jgi:uncharacterized protein (DUF2132 family)
MANINLNYWDVYPGQRVITPFALLYNEDKSAKKLKSSQVMWALNMYCSSKKDNPMHNMTLEEREQELLENYITQEQLNTVIALEPAFVAQSLSYLQKRFRFYLRILEQREEYMGTLKYSTHASTLDDMLAKTKKIWDDILTIKKQLGAEEDEAQVKGGREESASEKGLL